MTPERAIGRRGRVGVSEDSRRRAHLDWRVIARPRSARRDACHSADRSSSTKRVNPLVKRVAGGAGSIGSAFVLAFRSAAREAHGVWAPRPRPEWLEELNALGARLGNASGIVALDAASLEAAARANTGLDDFGDDGWREPFGVLLNALQTEGRLHLGGRIIARTEVLRGLVNRLRIADLTRREPAILDAPVRAPSSSPGPGARGRRCCWSCSQPTPATGRRSRGSCSTRARRPATTFQPTTRASPARIGRSRSGTSSRPNTAQCTRTAPRCPMSASS